MSAAIGERIVAEVSSWIGVTVHPHRFGGVELRVGRSQPAHLPGERIASLPFPVRVREWLVAEGKAQRHHILPDSGWVSVPIRGAADVARVIDLFRLNYDRCF